MKPLNKKQIICLVLGLFFALAVIAIGIWAGTSGVLMDKNAVPPTEKVVSCLIDFSRDAMWNEWKRFTLYVADIVRPEKIRHWRPGYFVRTAGECAYHREHQYKEAHQFLAGHGGQ